MRTGGAVLAIASVILLGACGGGGGTPSAPSTPAPTPASRAEVTVSIAPASPVAQPSNDRTYPWRVEWTLVLKETAGLGGNVNYVDVSFVNNFGFETPGNLDLPRSCPWSGCGSEGMGVAFTTKGTASPGDPRSGTRREARRRAGSPSAR